MSRRVPQDPQLDGTDLKILAALSRDGRLTNAALAAQVGVAESTCAYRVRALRASGVITAVHAHIDTAALGRPLQAIIRVRLGGHNRDPVRTLFDRLVETPGVLAVFHVSGDDDFLVHAAVATPQDLRDLILERITVHPGVRQTQTQLVFEARAGVGVLPPSPALEARKTTRPTR